MIICVTGWFPIYKNGINTGKKEFVVSHGVDYMTGKIVILPCERLEVLGAKYEPDLGEWVL